MTEEDFWKLIDDVLVPLDSSYSIEKHTSLYTEALNRLSTDDLSDFIAIQRFFLAKGDRFDLWQVAYIVSNGCDEDDCMYFMTGIVNQGKQTYYSLLADPEATLLKLEGADQLIRCFPLTYAADMIFTERTGIEEVEVEKEGFNITPNPTETDDFSDDPKVLKRKFPKLFDKYWVGDRE